MKIADQGFDTNTMMSINFSTCFLSNDDTWAPEASATSTWCMPVYRFHNVSSHAAYISAVGVQTWARVGVSPLSEPEPRLSTEPSPGSRLQRQRSDYLKTFRCLQARSSCWDVGESLKVARLTWCGGQPALHKSCLEQEGRAWRSNPSALANDFNPPRRVFITAACSSE